METKITKRRSEDSAHGSFLGSPARRMEAGAVEEEHNQSINQMMDSTHVSLP